MQPALRPLLTVLVVVLLTTYGTCPCVFADMLAGAGSNAAEDAPASKPCCCKQQQEPDDEPQPGDDDCPCCASGGWMRDLPPQVADVQPDEVQQAAFDLPAVTLAVAPAPILRDLVPEVAGPPRTSAHRPHAAPVGVVRLLI